LLVTRSAREPSAQNAPYFPFSLRMGAHGFEKTPQSASSLFERGKAFSAVAAMRQTDSRFYSTSFGWFFFLSVLTDRREPSAQNAPYFPFLLLSGALGFAFAARRSGSSLTRRRACESSPSARFPFFTPPHSRWFFFLSVLTDRREPSAQNAPHFPFSLHSGALGFAFAARRSGSVRILAFGEIPVFTPPHSDGFSFCRSLRTEENPARKTHRTSLSLLHMGALGFEKTPQSASSLFERGKAFSAVAAMRQTDSRPAPPHSRWFFTNVVG